MNRAIAAIYAITINHTGRNMTPDEQSKVIERVPALIDEVIRLEKLLNDPFIAGYLEAKRLGIIGGAGPTVSPQRT